MHTYQMYKNTLMYMIRPIGLMGGVFNPSLSHTKVSKRKKMYLISPCLTLSIIRYRSRVKWSNPRKEVVPSPTPQCSNYWKGSHWVALNYSCQLIYIYIYMHTHTYHKCIKMYIHSDILQTLIDTHTHTHIYIYIYIFIY